MTVRAKFRLVNETRSSFNDGRTLIFQPMYDPQLADEDRSFAKATPSGKLEIYVDNPAVDFVLGQDYYLDFTPVPAAAE